MPDPRGGPPARPAWAKVASSGLDLAIVVGGFTALGWWLDRRYGWGPWGTLVGAVLGVVGGLANFLRVAFAASRPGRDDRIGRDGRGDGG